MSDAYGNQVSRWQAYMSAYVLSSTDTAVTVRVDVYFHSVAWGYSLTTCIDTWIHCDGQDSGWTGNKSFYSSTGETKNGYLVTRDFTVARGQSTSGRWITCECGVSNSGGYHSGVSTASCSVWVDPRVYYKPHAPANLKVARANDTVMKLAFQGNYTGLDGYYPWTGIYVDRATDGGGWQTIATLSWSATNYDDASTSSGHRYDYRLRSYGPGGTSDPTGAVTMYTTPEAYGDVVATKPTTTSVKLSAGTAPRYVTGQVFEASTDGGATWAAVTFSDWVCSNPPEGTAMFRVAATIMSGGENSTKLQSRWAYSNTIATLCAPLAPTLAPLPSVVATGTTQGVRWVPNHPDGTAQSKAQVEVTVGDGAATTYDVAGATTSYALPAAATKSAATVKVRVRTYGDYAAWGEWSSYQAMRVAVGPVLTLTSPTDGGKLTRLPMVVSWDYSDVTGASVQTVTVERLGDGTSAAADGDAAVAEVKSMTMLVDVGTTSIEWGAAPVRFDNGARYRVTVSVTAGSGLSVSKSATVTVDWDKPSVPAVRVEPNDTYAAVLTISASLVDPVAKSFAVTRVNPDGTRVKIADGVTDKQSVIDWLAPLNVAYRYEVTGIAASGSTSTLTVDAFIDSDGHEVFNFGMDASVGLPLRYNAQGTRTVQASGETFHFALGQGADRLPAFYADGDVDASGTHSYVVTKATEYNRVLQLAMDYADGWFRDAWGNVYTCTMSWQLGYDAAQYGQFTVAVNTTQTMWEEPNRG